jgi:hypothetical protein
VALRRFTHSIVSPFDLTHLQAEFETMQSINRSAVLLSVIFFTTSTPIASAHNLYVLIEKQPGSTDLVDVIFEHSPYPGKGTYNGPLIERGKTWVMAVDGTTKSLPKLDEKQRLGKKFLQTRTQSEEPRAIIHSCQWGVYKGRLDYFHGKYLDVVSPEQLDRLAVTETLPLDLVPRIDGSALEVVVLKDGQPVANGKIWIWSPNGQESQEPTDDQGRLRIEKPLDGTYSFAAIHTNPEPEGEFEGESYKGVMHGTTVTIRLPLGGPDE